MRLFEHHHPKIKKNIQNNVVLSLIHFNNINKTGNYTCSVNKL